MAERGTLYNDNEESLRAAFDGFQSSVWTALPGYITAVDFTTMTVTVQPTVQGVITGIDGTETKVNLPLLIHVPVCFPKAGGFALTLPIAVNDEVLVVFASRCIDAWWQQSGVQPPMEDRMHDLSDGFCIPGPCSVPNVIPNISTTGAQLRNTAGTTYIELSANGNIKIVTPGELDITGPVNITGDVIVTGKVTASGEVMSGVIPLTAHIHSGVTTGTGNSGGPLP